MLNLDLISFPTECALIPLMLDCSALEGRPFGVSASFSLTCFHLAILPSEPVIIFASTYPACTTADVIEWLAGARSLVSCRT